MKLKLDPEIGLHVDAQIQARHCLKLLSSVNSFILGIRSKVLLHYACAVKMASLGRFRGRGSCLC